MNDRMGRPIEQRSPIARRFGDLLGHTQLARKLAAITGRQRSAFYEWERKGEWPQYAIVILELLEVTPPEDWPSSVRATKAIAPPGDDD